MYLVRRLHRCEHAVVYHSYCGCYVLTCPLVLFVTCAPSSEVQVTYPSAALATIACNTLDVDEELQPNKIVRHLRVEGPSLVA